MKKIKKRKKVKKASSRWAKALEAGLEVWERDELAAWFERDIVRAVLSETCKRDLGPKKALNAEIRQVFWVSTWFGLTPEAQKPGATKALGRAMRKSDDPLEAAVRIRKQFADVAVDE